MSDPQDPNNGMAGIPAGTASPPPAIIRVPQTPDDMLPPRQNSLIGELATCQRSNHWDEVKPLWEAMSGEKPSLNGSFRMDEAAAAFKFKEIALTNGYPLMAAATPAQIRRAMRYAYKRNTGISVRKLEAQNRRLRLTHQPTP